MDLVLDLVFAFFSYENEGIPHAYIPYISQLPEQSVIEVVTQVNQKGSKIVLESGSHEEGHEQMKIEQS